MAAENTDRMEVRYEVAGRRIYLDGTGITKTSRAARKLLIRQERTLLKRFEKLRHPVTGERPVLTISIPDPSKKGAAQARLDTDSAELRDWLKSQGIVIAEGIGARLSDEVMADGDDAEISGDESFQACSTGEERP